ncbi:hypothetical protein [Perlucidibaca piscinae]|uniref:hypothetical protein n=1 Tax=Perlucidibaca piscinae TaxID=392589 RepID=UPI00146A5E7E|nr:hypothetical protein [Perlucidibaca piscinae]
MDRFINKYFLPAIEFLPFCKGISRVQKKNFLDAASDVAITVLLATFPLWAAAFFAAMSNEKDIDSFVAAVASVGNMLYVQINDGALILYSASLIAPVLVMALEFRKDSQILKVPSPMSYIVSVFMIQTAATIYFSKKASNDYINIEFAYYVSISMFLLTIIILYIVNCFRYFEAGIDPGSEIESSAKKFRDGYSRHRGVQ